MSASWGDEECGGKGFPRGSGGITTMVFGDPTSSTFLISSQPPKPQEPGAVEKTLSSPLVVPSTTVIVSNLRLLEHYSCIKRNRECSTPLCEAAMITGWKVTACFVWRSTNASFRQICAQGLRGGGEDGGDGGEGANAPINCSSLTAPFIIQSYTILQCCVAVQVQCNVSRFKI